MTIDRITPFPVDYDGEFDARYIEWMRWLKDQHVLHQPTRSFPGVNFMADRVLARFDLGGRTIELSQITMPDLSGQTRQEVRLIGVTYYEPRDSVRRTAGPFDTFAELEAWMGVSTA